ncbi:hypothetical protein FF38_07519 [Lucilia cuprina]|uniref:Uncharacterized protein n=1 Tax=Lucilia cuprina TaxID=7375 RepID=A0A0L0CP09_LUCCU|nr:hypothetical protein FF38_07519 [Lucilia cuprina]
MNSQLYAVTLGRFKAAVKICMNVPTKTQHLENLKKTEDILNVLGKFCKECGLYIIFLFTNKWLVDACYDIIRQMKSNLCKSVFKGIGFNTVLLKSLGGYINHLLMATVLHTASLHLEIRNIIALLRILLLCNGNSYRDKNKLFQICSLHLQLVGPSGNLQVKK